MREDIESSRREESSDIQEEGYSIVRGHMQEVTPERKWGSSITSEGGSMVIALTSIYPVE